MMITSKYSFRLISREKGFSNNPATKNSEQGKAGISDDSKKRAFLKLAGMVGVGALATSLIPKKAEALVFGSTPAANTVGVKNSSNARVNPATEETAAGIKVGTDNIAGLKTTADLIKVNSDKFTFVGDSLKTVSSGGSDVVGIKDASNVRMTPAQDDSVVLLRRMVKLMESQAVVDASMRQRVAVEVMPSTAVTGTLTTVTTVTNVTSLNQFGGIDSRYSVIDWARQAYNGGIRSNLVNS